MLFDLHCDSLSLEKPLLGRKIFGKGEIKLLALFCEDLPITQQNKALSYQYRRFCLAEKMGIFTRYPQKGKRRAILAMEGAGGIKNPAELAVWKARGLSVLSLCWKSNRLATGWEKETDEGVSLEGLQFLTEINRLHIVGDISHVSPCSARQTMHQVERVIASHSLFSAIHSHPRNLSPKTADALYEKGGIIGLVPYPPFAGESLQEFFAHVAYGMSRYGNRFLAIGTDTDGTKGIYCKGLQANQPLMPQLFRGLKDRFGVKTAYRICYENAAEFFSV